MRQKPITDKNGSLGFKPRTGVYVNCEVCGKESYYKPSAYKKRQHYFCSRDCHHKGQEKRVAMVCGTCGKVYSRPESTVKWQAIRGNHKDYCSKACYGISLKAKFAGEKSPHWRGGTSRAYKYGYNGPEYKAWRERVFKRDSYTCQYCGKKGGYIEPHHIFSFSSFPEFRFFTHNGITLCKSCHNTTKINFRDMKLQLFEDVA